MKRICVFTGSSSGARQAYVDGARALGASIAEARLSLVYGGARVGLMGELADAVLEKHGEVIGVIPRSLVEKEVAHPGLTELHVVDSMHERKARMVELADGFITMPGGLGTLEETFEVLTWAQLGFHHLPCGFLNLAGFYDELLGFLDFTVDELFVKAEHRGMILVGDDPRELLDELRRYEAPEIDKWIDRKGL